MSMEGEDINEEFNRELEHDLNVLSENLGTGSRAEFWVASLYHRNFMERLYGFLKEPRGRHLNQFVKSIKRAISERVLLAWERLGRTYLRKCLFKKYLLNPPFSFYCACACLVFQEMEKHCVEVHQYKIPIEDAALIKADIIQDVPWTSSPWARKHVVYTKPITIFDQVFLAYGEDANKMALLNMAVVVDYSHLEQDLLYNEKTGAVSGTVPPVGTKRKADAVRATDEEAGQEYKFLLITETIIEIIFRRLKAGKYRLRLENVSISCTF